MQRVDFFRLARPIQERFVAATQGVAPPHPLAVERAPLPRAVLVLASVALLSLIAIVGTWTLGYGRLDSALALQPAMLMVVYAALGAIAAGSLVAARLQLKKGNKFPFPHAAFLFPANLVDARGSELVVYPLSDLASATANRTRVQLLFPDGARFNFATPSAERAAELAKTVHDLQARIRGDLSPVSSRDVVALDPLADTGFSNPFSPRESLPPPPRRLAVGGSLLLIAALVGAASGAGLWKVRNTLGEQALYRSARAEHTQAGYRAYVERGGQNPDVREVLLPRAELAEVEKRHDIVELEKFADEHKGSRIEPEIQAVLHRELVTALAAAKKSGSLRLLKEFRARYQGRPSITQEVDRAIAERLNAAFADFTRRAQPRPSVADLYRRLLNYVSQNEGKVELRFRRRIPESVARAETLLQKSNYFGGKASLPGQYFDAAHAEKREAPVAEELLATLSRAFPEDVLKFELAAPIPDSAEEDPKVSVPTLVITHRTEMSGAYLMKRPKAALTGVGILFRVAFQIPNDPQVHNFKFSTWQAPDLKSMIEGRSFEQIYGEMGDKSFAKLAKKYVSDTTPGLLKPPG